MTHREHGPTLHFLGQTIPLPMVRPGWWPRPRHDGSAATPNERDSEHTVEVVSRRDEDGDPVEWTWTRPEARDHWRADVWDDYPVRVWRSR